MSNVSRVTLAVIAVVAFACERAPAPPPPPVVPPRPRPAPVRTAPPVVAPKAVDEPTPGMPESYFVEAEHVWGRASREGIDIWVALYQTKDGLLSTLFQWGERPFLSLVIMVRNRSSETVTFSALAPVLLKKDGKEIRTFPPGARNPDRPENRLGLMEPRVIELDGLDISTRKWTSIELERGHYTVMEANFEMPGLKTEAQARAIVRALRLPVRGTPLVVTFD